MPTPTEILLDPVSLTIIGIYLGLILMEAIWPGKELPKVKYWKVRGLLSFLIFFYLATYLPLMWDSYLAKYQLFDLSGLGVAIGTILGVLIYEFGVYCWHRFMHSSDFMWKSFHQMHHSSERLDTFSAFYFSPLDMIGWTLLGSFCLVLVVGLNPIAGTYTLIFVNFLAIFQHTNLKTPRWLGYIIQRPESHSVHHARGIHKFNYSDLPLFDILFGTFKNPKSFQNETGFYDGASNRVREMIFFKDVSKPNKK